MKYTDINGIEFETIKSKYTKQMIDNHFHNKIKTLDDCYEKPSEYKRTIYYEICNLFGNSKNIIKLSITSFNIFQFTMGAIYIDEFTNNLIGYIHITKEHNRLYLL